MKNGMNYHRGVNTVELELPYLPPACDRDLKIADMAGGILGVVDKYVSHCFLDRAKNIYI